MLSRCIAVLLLTCLSPLVVAEDAPVAATATPTVGVVESKTVKEIKAETKDVQEDELNFMPAFTNSVMMIWVTELGDKTFFIAAILAMRFDRGVIFTGALGALAVMTVLSAVLGYALPNIMPRKYAHYAAALLFLYFGILLIKDAMGMDAGGVSDEMEEAEEELADIDVELGIMPEADADAVDMDTGEKTSEEQVADSTETDPSITKNQDPATPAEMTAAQKTALFSKAFMLTFLAEWGDRSQIATIALAADKNPFGVVVGGILGHAMCTGLAVMGGKALGTQISERSVSYAGGILFLLFAVHSFISEG